MDRNREARRATMAATNGLSRRRHRSNSLRDSPEEDGPVELQETARLRDRGVIGKKDRDRDRDRDRERDRDRDRDRDRLSRNKRRRTDRLLHGSNREDGGEESSEESVNDEEEDEDDDGAASLRMLPPNPAPLSSSTSMSNHRKSFPPPAKLFRAAPAWKAADEMIGVSVPRKARSASTKRSHECWVGVGGVVGEQTLRQASTSPVRPGLVSMPTAPSPAPASPSSSNASVRKKMKPNGPKPRPPKSSSKSSSSAQEEIEIEIAEVLYGMGRQPQGPSKQEILATDSIKLDAREANKSASDAKSRVSSPISNSPSAVPPTSSLLPQNSSSSVTLMSTVVAPKRKKPRAVKYDDENPSIYTARSSPILSTTKAEIDQPAKIGTSSSPNLEKNLGSVTENCGVSYDMANLQVVSASSEAQPEPTIKPESNHMSDSRPLTEESGDKDVGVSKEEPPQSPKKESPVLRLDDIRDDAKANKANSIISEVESHKEEKFQIDLRAPPSPLRSSPERDGEVDFVAVDPKSVVTDADMDIKTVVMEDEKTVKTSKEEAVNVVKEKAKTVAAEETESQKPAVVHKDRNIDLQLDLEKTDRDSGTASVSGNKLHHHVQKHPQPHPASSERSVPAQTNSLPLAMSVPGWPGSLPPMGYMAPLQGVVSMDGTTVSPAAVQPPHLLFTQPRPKRCATHYYIARNIVYHQQLARMNPFWPAAAGAASLYGAKPCNLNVVPPAELHGNIPARGVNSAQDKGQGLAMFPGHTGKDKGSQTASNIVDAAQRKQILLQQALPPGAPSNILHGPAFIFPLSQQQAAAAASVRSGSVKTPATAGSAASSSNSNSGAASASATAAAPAAPAMSFNYTNMPGGETQYLAILQNNAYPFPISPHVGAPPAYRTHAQPMPIFNGSFYSSQMLHPSQIHQQQQLPAQSQQNLHGHQNPSISTGSSSSQKHLQNQQQRPHGNGGSGTLHGFPAAKNQSSQPLQLQQRQQQQSQLVSLQARQLESEMGGEDSPSSADSRVSRAANMNIYGQNFAMPMHHPNFALMTPATMGSAPGATGASGGGHTDKKQQQQPQQQGSKAGMEPLQSQAFAMSFASINGATTTHGLDISSIGHNPAFLQNLPDVTRQSYQIIAQAAQQQQQKKNYRVSEEGKTGGGDSSNAEEERKSMPGKASATVGQSIAFSRQDLTDTSAKGNNVVDSSARALNLGSAPGRNSGSVMGPGICSVNAPGAQQQLQRNQQQQQVIQLQKQSPFPAAAVSRSKNPATSNGSVYSDHLPSSSSMGTKFTNALSSFPQNLVQASGNSPAQSPQWKNSVRTTTSQVPSPSMSTSSNSSLKNLSQHQGRTQQSHTQISFVANAKSSTVPQGQQPPNSIQSQSTPVMVGSPTTSSISKSAGGSPRTTASASTANKGGQGSTMSSQQAKNSPSVPSRKSSPVGGRNVPSILGNPHITSTSSGATKPQMPQQQQPQQLPKQALQQAQLFFSNAYMQVPAGTASASAASGYYPQRNRREQQQQAQGSSATCSTGMLSLCPPVSLANAATSDPARLVAAAATAASNMKGGLPSQGILHVTQFGAAQSSGNPHHLLPPGFSFHAVPTPIQVKPAEQKQPAGE